MLEALRAHPEVLAEAIQTALRREKVAVPYEQLKELTRGRQVTLKDFATFIDSLDIDPKLKNASRRSDRRTISVLPRKSHEANYCFRPKSRADEVHIYRDEDDDEP